MASLYEDALVFETGSAITSTGALTAYSGKKTGRSPQDKRIVKEDGSSKSVWWGPVNKPMTPEVSVRPTSRTVPAAAIVWLLLSPSLRLGPPLLPLSKKPKLAWEMRSRAPASGPAFHFPGHALHP